jgi:hypothetical protein
MNGKIPNMHEFKIEKKLFVVKVFFLDGTIKEGGIYLSLQAAHREGPETVSDVLNQKEQFIPINFVGEQVSLTNKSHIMMLSFPLGREKTENSAQGYIKNVEISLINMTNKEGTLTFQLPRHLTRLKDFFNQAGSFVEFTIDEEMYLINKDHILSVRENRKMSRGEK